MEYKGFTYTPTPKTAWDNLSMLEKSEMMKVAVRNGITDLKTIREKYNEFADGGNINPGMTGMMKAKLATAAHFGNPTARRMTNYDTRSFTWPGEYEYNRGIGEPKRGNVFVGSYGNLATPQIQDNGNGLSFIDNVWSPENDQRSYLQSLKFDNENDARYFGEHYKEIVPMMNLYSMGGHKIHIKPENRGKFTALKKRTGHSATWFKEHGTPAQKKMAIFALNSRHWKHGEGGFLQGPIVDMANMYEDGGFLEWLKGIYHGAMQTIGLEDTPEELSFKRGNERYKQYGYIGGEPRETRQKYFTIDKEFTDSVNSISKRYGLNPSVVASRIAEEGPIDNAIDIYNNKEKKGTTGLILSDDRNKGTFGPLWGLDDFYTRANDEKVKVTTSAPHSYKKQMFINEHGRLTESIVSPQWWFGIEATAAEMKARRDKLKKNNPWMNSQQLDAATSMSFNYGEWGVQKHINKKKSIPKGFNPYIKTE